MMNAIISDLRQVYTSNPEYTYVPTFYVKGVKVHEGTVTKRQVLEVLQEAARRLL